MRIPALQAINCRLAQEGSPNRSCLAARFHVSTRTLLRRFRAETGQTPLVYLHAARVRRACQLLETTDLTISAVADSEGHRDADHDLQPPHRPQADRLMQRIPAPE